MLQKHFVKKILLNHPSFGVGPSTDKSCVLKVSNKRGRGKVCSSKAFIYTDIFLRAQSVFDNELFHGHHQNVSFWNLSQNCVLLRIVF
jgi:hypothetical protein